VRLRHGAVFLSYAYVLFVQAAAREEQVKAASAARQAAPELIASEKKVKKDPLAALLQATESLGGRVAPNATKAAAAAASAQPAAVQQLAVPASAEKARSESPRVKREVPDASGLVLRPKFLLHLMPDILFRRNPELRSTPPQRSPLASSCSLMYAVAA
jgi:hypothetical protein